MPYILKAQIMNHYWSQSYNSISTLLSGAVVGGDAGNASIFYNPSGIVDLEEGNNISVAASIFTFNTYGLKDMMGEGKNIVSSNLYVQPQFFSYGVKSPFKKWSFELAVFNRLRENMTLNYSGSDDFTLNGIAQSKNRINTVFNYHNYYSDTWVGIGGGYKYSDNLSLGISVNLSFLSFKYYNRLTSSVYPLYADTSSFDSNTALLAENELNESIVFNNIRVVSKVGATYKKDKFTLGINISFPALKLFSVGERVSKELKEIYNQAIDPQNIRTDYYIFDSQKGSEVQTNLKLPFSIAIGTTYQLLNNAKIYFTAEYFDGKGLYKMVDAQTKTDITTDIIYDKLKNKDWLSYKISSRPVINVALGYQWQIKHDVLFLMGFRTDLNNLHRSDVGLDYLSASLYSTTTNLFHATGGVKFSLKKHLLIAGTQFSFGRQTKAIQISNFKSSDDIIASNNIMPLMGNRENQGRINQFSISLFLGATLNFASKAKKHDK